MQQRRIIPIALMLLVAGCGGGSGNLPDAGAAPVPGPVEVEAAPLRPGDVIRLSIWREPELSGEFVIDRSGAVVLPKIGPTAAADFSPDSLEAHLRQEYDRYLRNPSIEIVFLRRINILGAVRSPGLFSVDPTMSLRDVLALAGGVLSNGQQDRIELVRGETRLVTNVSGDTRIADLGLRSGDQLYVPERTWLSRNAGVIATVASTVISATVSLIIAFNSR